jgi:hypothetical protein
VPTNNAGPAARQGDTYRFRLDIDKCINRADERGWHKIVDRTASTFVIEGDYTNVFTPGSGFRVLGSTNNNKQWAVASSAYSGGETTITVTATVGAVVDGYIEAYDW